MPAMVRSGTRGKEDNSAYLQHRRGHPHDLVKNIDVVQAEKAIKISYPCRKQRLKGNDGKHDESEAVSELDITILRQPRMGQACRQKRDQEEKDIDRNSQDLRPGLPLMRRYVVQDPHFSLPGGPSPP
jgi:hypothetical protein